MSSQEGDNFFGRLFSIRSVLNFLTFNFEMSSYKIVKEVTYWFCLGEVLGVFFPPMYKLSLVVMSDTRLSLNVLFFKHFLAHHFYNFPVYSIYYFFFGFISRAFCSLLLVFTRV